MDPQVWRFVERMWLNVSHMVPVRSFGGVWDELWQVHFEFGAAVQMVGVPAGGGPLAVVDAVTGRAL